MTEQRGRINLAQYQYLMAPLKSTRVAMRENKYSYLAAWDVKAHLTRLFGFGGWDNLTIREQFMGMYPYNDEKMVCVVWQATVRLTIYDEQGDVITVQQEGAVGSATGSAGSSKVGDLHDNALKQAASDALKRCAIAMGTQFGLSLYNDGQTSDVVRMTLVGPKGFDAAKEGPSAEKQKQLDESLGGQQVKSDERTNEGEPGDTVGETPETTP